VLINQTGDDDLSDSKPKGKPVDLSNQMEDYMIEDDIG
jgi:hypothetical protein